MKTIELRPFEEKDTEDASKLFAESFPRYLTINNSGSFFRLKN